VESLILSAITLVDILNSAKNIGMVAIGLGFVVFVHELGHFLVAKACGVKCEKFYVGFDVPIPLGFFTIPGKLLHFTWGETEYGLGAIPLGGYVKMLGQDDNPQNAETESERTKLRDDTGNVQLDPRSYPAKSVPKRMAIISAGVIMNIIFGFIFAAVAYRVGVVIQPAVIGATTPGDPAWKLNLQPGDRILQIGKSGTPNEHMRFGKDMMLNLALYIGFDNDVDVLIRHHDGRQEWVTLRPSDRLRHTKESRPTIGITGSASIEFGEVSREELPIIGEVYEQIKSGDKLLAINGEPVRDYADVQRLLAKAPSQSIKLTIQKAPAKDGAPSSASPEQYELEVPARPAIDYGIEMASSAITAVQKNSPAEKAGLLPGDRLISFDGEPIGDPLAFPQTTLSRIGDTVDVVVDRMEDKSPKRVAVPITLRAPNQIYMVPAASSVVAVETMGIAYDITTTVAKVQPGGPAEGKLQPGDEIVKVQFQQAGDEQVKAEEAVETTRRPKEAISIDGKVHGWVYVINDASISRMADSKLLLTIKRDGKELETPIELLGVPSQKLFVDHRNIPFRALTEMHVAQNWQEACSLGAREMKERVTEVFTVVTRLVTGRLSLFNMGGPITIFRVAGAEADRGITDLLMFFAFLSANLAVLNFLPIPALDGGHMLFLAYEGIRRKPVDENLQMKLSAAGILSLLALMLFVTILDVQRLFW